MSTIISSPVIGQHTSLSKNSYWFYNFSMLKCTEMSDPEAIGICLEKSFDWIGGQEKFDCESDFNFKMLRNVKKITQGDSKLRQSENVHPSRSLILS